LQLSIDIKHIHGFQFLSFGIIRFYTFGHLMIDENAIKAFPLRVEVNIEQLNQEKRRP